MGLFAWIVVCHYWIHGVVDDKYFDSTVVHVSSTLTGAEEYKYWKTLHLNREGMDETQPWNQVRYVYSIEKMTVDSMDD